MTKGIITQVSSEKLDQFVVSTCVMQQGYLPEPKRAICKKLPKKIVNERKL